MTSSTPASGSLRVLSFNCWGLKFVAKNRQERIAAIADHLSSTDYDIISLQELWVYSDFELIRDHVKSTLPESKFWSSGTLGSGLALFSRWPIISTSIHPFSLNGSPLDVAGGDYFVGKSIVSILIEHPILGEVEVFNTHMYAKGGEDGPEWRRAHRLVGAWQIANLTRKSARLGRYVILAGDFNSIPTSVVIDIVRTHGGLTDSWAASHDSSLFPTSVVHTPQHAIHDFGVTADSPLNSYSAGKVLDATAKRWQGKRLDYIFFRKPHPKYIASTSGADLPASSNSLPELYCSESKVVLTNTIPGHSNISYSDHFGVEATLDIRYHRHSRSSTSSPEVPSEDHHHQKHPSNGHTIGFSSSVSSDESTVGMTSSAIGLPLQTYTPAEQHLSSKILTTTLDALSIARQKAQQRSTFQLTAFVVLLCAAVGVVVGSYWQPRPEFNPLVTLVAVVFGWAATTMLYSGFIYEKYEVNMFTNVIEELELLRNRQRSQRH